MSHWLFHVAVYNTQPVIVPPLFQKEVADVGNPSVHLTELSYGD